MVNPRRLAIRGHGAGITDAIFVVTRRNPDDFFSLARRQREIDRPGAGSHLELADMSSRREARKRTVSWALTLGARNTGSIKQGAANRNDPHIAAPLHFISMPSSARMSLNTTAMAR